MQFLVGFEFSDQFKFSCNCQMSNASVKDFLLVLGPLKMSDDFQFTAHAACELQ